MCTDGIGTAQKLSADIMVRFLCSCFCHLVAGLTNTVTHRSLVEKTPQSPTCGLTIIIHHQPMQKQQPNNQFWELLFFGCLRRRRPARPSERFVLTTFNNLQKWWQTIPTKKGFANCQLYSNCTSWAYWFWISKKRKPEAKIKPRRTSDWQTPNTIHSVGIRLTNDPCSCSFVDTIGGPCPPPWWFLLHNNDDDGAGSHHHKGCP